MYVRTSLPFFCGGLCGKFIFTGPWFSAITRRVRKDVPWFSAITRRVRQDVSWFSVITKRDHKIVIIITSHALAAVIHSSQASSFLNQPNVVVVEGDTATKTENVNMEYSRNISADNAGGNVGSSRVFELKDSREIERDTFFGTPEAGSHQAKFTGFLGPKAGEVEANPSQPLEAPSVPWTDKTQRAAAGGGVPCGRGGFRNDGAAMISVGDIGGGKARREGGEEKHEEKKGMDPLLMVTRGDGRDGGGMDNGPDQDPMVPSSQAIMVPGFDVIGEHTGAGHNCNIVMPFGGESLGLEGPES
ncbi:hypothetical protein M5K25_008307 [Dendrobium thyrsiflorum]|uniref:Uncharacterized protein n=1 Tax=Dendrobium thyrsiflorum TaxID=117978 RepID=A0ABD0V8A5_DENTH